MPTFDDFNGHTQGDCCGASAPRNTPFAKPSSPATRFRSSLLSLPGPIRTVSNVPGRVRFRTDAVVGNDSARSVLVEQLGNLEGVESLEVNLRTGSVLVKYQPAKLTPELLFVGIAKLLNLEAQLLRTPNPLVVREFRAIVSSLNRSVYEATRGVADLGTFIMFALAGIGIYKLRTLPLDRAFPPGITLLWWFFHTMNRDNRGLD